MTRSKTLIRLRSKLFECLSVKLFFMSDSLNRSKAQMHLEWKYLFLARRHEMID